MDGKKKMPPPRPVTVAKKKMPVSDRLACGWALLSACAIAFGHYHRLSCSQAVLRCGFVELTGTKAIYFSALWIGAICCTAFQAAAAALALLLPRRHRWVSREDLAFLAGALAGAGHCMYHGSVYILRRGGYFTVASPLFVVGDIIRSLLLQGSVRLDCGWALLRACAMAFGLHHLPCSEASLVLRCGCVELTDTKAAYFSALWVGILCCTASQAAAAALALLLPRRHRQVSREVAFLALVLATAGHSMYNGAAYLLRPEY